MTKTSAGNNGAGQLKLSAPEDLRSALAPQIDQAQQQVAREKDAFRKGMREKRDKKDTKRLADPDQNLVLAGRPRPPVPAILPGSETAEAVDAVLAYDDGDLKTRRKTLGRHAKARLINPQSVRGTNGKLKGNTKKLDETLGETEWLTVYDHFRVTAMPDRLATATGLSKEAVEYLLEIGVKRLNLPAIRVHATRTDVMHSLVQTSNPQLEDRRHVDEDPPPNLEASITSRAVRESAAAQQCLDSAIDANEIFASFVSKILEAVRAGNIEVGEKIHMGHLESLTKALSANTAALERAVKLSRLVRGETTDLVGAQINLLLQACSTDELEEAERTGSLPRRLINRFAGDSQVRQVIDVVAEKDSPDGR